MNDFAIIYLHVQNAAIMATPYVIGI